MTEDILKCSISENECNYIRSFQFLVDGDDVIFKNSLATIEAVGMEVDRETLKYYIEMSREHRLGLEFALNELKMKYFNHIENVEQWYVYVDFITRTMTLSKTQQGGNCSCSI